MNAKALLTSMVYQLYSDIRFVTEHNPTQVVDDDGVKVYNALLTRARQVFDDAEPIQEMENWTPRTIKYKDALLVVGQLHAMINAFSGGSVSLPAGAPAAPQHPQASPQPVRQPQQGQPPQQAQPRPASHAEAQRNARQHPSNNDSLDAVGNESYDSELYGPSKPTGRNEDGTIPFSLE